MGTGRDQTLGSGFSVWPSMAVCLGSPAARRVSGQIIAVDGHTENPDPKV